MTGTDLCVNKPQSFPVTFEPSCVHLPLRVTALAQLFYSPSLVATGRYVPLHQKEYICIVNSAKPV